MVLGEGSKLYVFGLLILYKKKIFVVRRDRRGSSNPSVQVQRTPRTTPHHHKPVAAGGPRLVYYSTIHRYVFVGAFVFVEGEPPTHPPTHHPDRRSRMALDRLALTCAFKCARGRGAKNDGGKNVLGVGRPAGRRTGDRFSESRRRSERYPRPPRHPPAGGSATRVYDPRRIRPRRVVRRSSPTPRKRFV